MTITIKDAVLKFFTSNFGRPCEAGQSILDTAGHCRHDCGNDSGLKCWQRILSEVKKENGQDNT